MDSFRGFWRRALAIPGHSASPPLRKLWLLVSVCTAQMVTTSSKTRRWPKVANWISDGLNPSMAGTLLAGVLVAAESVTGLVAAREIPHRLKERTRTVTTRSLAGLVGSMR